MSYLHLPGLTPDGQIYLNEEMGIREALIPTGPYRSAHAPAMLEADNGDLLCAWFAGSWEGNADISIICARLPYGSDRWEEPVRVSHDPERSEQNPSLFSGPDGKIWVIYTAQMDRQEEKDNMQFTAVIRRQKSADYGRTWSEPELLFGRPGSFCRQPIQVLENGRWIFGNWLCTDSELGLAGDPTVFQISDDQGESWKVAEVPKSSGRVHANVIELGGGRLRAFLRSRAADFIYRSDSFDYGDSWTVPVPTELPNNNSSISACRLKSGRIALAYNPTSVTNPVQGIAAWPGLRCPVAVALSEDEGITWPLIRVIERGEGYIGAENRGNNRSYEYPYLFQSRDQRLHLAYAFRNRQGIKYASFTEEDLIGEKREFL